MPWWAWLAIGGGAVLGAVLGATTMVYYIGDRMFRNF